MVNPIIFQDQSGLGEVIKSIGSAFGTALQKRQERAQASEAQQKYNTILQQTVGSLDQAATPTQIVGAFNRALQLGVPADTLKSAYSFYEPLIKGKIDEEADIRLFGNDLNKIENIEDDLSDASPNQIGPQSKNQLQTLSDEALTKMLGSKRFSKIAEGELKRREIAEKKNTDLWNYKPTQKFIETVDKEAQDAQFSNEIADEIIQLAPTVDPKNLRTFLASKYGDKLPVLFTPEAAGFKFLEKLQAKGLTSYFPRPTEKEFLFINSAQAQLGKTPEANLAVANLQKRFNSIPIQLAEIKDQIIEENGGNPPRDIAAKTRQRASEIKNALVADAASISLKYGDREQKKEANKYLKSIKSPLAKDLKPLPESIARKAYKEAKGDPALAEQIVFEMGYDSGEVIRGQ